MEATDERAGDGDDVERYEALRRRDLEGEASGWRLGLALLQRRCVAAWSRAWESTAASPPTKPAIETPLGGDEIVGVLGSMALACLGAG